MLDREVIREFLQNKFEDIGLDIPEDISEDTLVETFCKYTEDDYYEWLKDNFKSFFGHNDWVWIRKKIEQYSKH
ncbi:MAG: hypothetical protein AABY78_10165 [Nitrospirota bacterium]